jgi:hypothetical protein
MLVPLTIGKLIDFFSTGAVSDPVCMVGSQLKELASLFRALLPCRCYSTRLDVLRWSGL